MLENDRTQTPNSSLSKMTQQGAIAIGRTPARLAAIQSLYEMEMSDKAADIVLNDVARRRDMLSGEGDELGSPPPETDMAFCAELVHGVSENTEAIDHVIGRSMSEGRTPEKLEKILRIILRVGAYEIGQRRDIDPPVTISEFVKLTERFYADKEPGLVNGLLDHIARELRANDMARINDNARQR